VTDDRTENTELTDEELEEQNADELPDREVMSVLDIAEPLHGGYTIDPPPPATE